MRRSPLFTVLLALALGTLFVVTGGAQATKPAPAPGYNAPGYGLNGVNVVNVVNDVNDVNVVNQYFRLCRENPLTPPLEVMPLPWFQPPGRRLLAGSPLERSASDWLQQPYGLASPPGQLLAAAILASSSTPASRARGEDLLKQLAKAPSKEEEEEASASAYETRLRVARLATALLWKSNEKMILFDPDSAKAAKNDREVLNREKLVAALPEPLRAGPYYLLGETYERLQRYDEAVLAWMRLPTAYPENRPLAAQSLFKAAQTLLKLGRPEQAATLCREIETNYADFDWAVQSAQSLLRQRNDKTPRNSQ